jgi:Uma2 family endonuclease
LFILDAEHDLRRRPDVAFVSARRWPLERKIPLTGDWAIIPDLAVEVISPNDLFEAVIAKVGEYFRVGVQQVWLVIPLVQEVYVYESPTSIRLLTISDELEGGQLLSGFRMPVGNLFSEHAETGTAAAP